MLLDIKKVKRYGIEVWLVLLNGSEIRTALSEAQAKTIVLNLIKKGI